MEQNTLNAIKLRSLEPIPERVTSQYIAQLRCDTKRLIKAFEDERAWHNSARAMLSVYDHQKADGRLIELPCKAGDRLYVVDTDADPEVIDVEPAFVDNIVLCDDGTILIKGDAYDYVICTADNIINGSPYLDCYRVFRDYDDAENLVEELGGTIDK